MPANNSLTIKLDHFVHNFFSTDALFQEFPGYIIYVGGSTRPQYYRVLLEFQQKAGLLQNIPGCDMIRHWWMGIILFKLKITFVFQTTSFIYQEQFVHNFRALLNVGNIPVVVIWLDVGGEVERILGSNLIKLKIGSDAATNSLLVTRSLLLGRCCRGKGRCDHFRFIVFNLGFLLLKTLPLTNWTQSWQLHQQH